MGVQTTFRSVLRPITKTINTDMAGTLSFQGRATSIIITSGQSQDISALDHIEHLIEGQTIPITNESGVTINIASSLMSDGALVDIEHNTTAVLHWVNGQFHDAGGTARIKDVEDGVANLTGILTTHINATHANHNHDGSNTPKVLATNLDAAGGSEYDMLRIVAGQPVWNDPFDGIQADLCIVQNTDISTNINTASLIDIPLNGSVLKAGDDKLAASGNGIQVNYTGWVKATANVYMYSTGSRVSIAGQFAVNGTPVEGRAGMGYIRNSGGHNESSIFLSKWIYVNSGEVITFQGVRDGTVTTAVTLNGQNSFLEIELPANVMAKGDAGADGYAGWNWLYGAGAPHGGIGVNGDVYLHTATGDLLKKESDIWNVMMNIMGPQGPTGPIESIIWAEENGGLRDNNTQWSFGNGAVGNIGITMNKSGTVTGMSLSNETAGTGTTTVELLINGLSVGRSITLAGNINDGFTNFATPIAFAAGDRLGFRTVLGGGANDSRVAAVVNMD